MIGANDGEIRFVELFSMGAASDFDRFLADDSFKLFFENLRLRRIINNKRIVFIVVFRR